MKCGKSGSVRENVAGGKFKVQSQRIRALGTRLPGPATVAKHITKSGIRSLRGSLATAQPLQAFIRPPPLPFLVAPTFESRGLLEFPVVFHTLTKLAVALSAIASTMLSFLNRWRNRSSDYSLISGREQLEQHDPNVDSISPEDVRRKIDRNYLDKATLGRAAVLGFIEDNKLNANQLNHLSGLSPFRIPAECCAPARTCGEMDIAQRICEFWIWGIAMVSQSMRLPFSSLLACRFILGVCEGSITSGFLMVTSMFYTKNEQSSRVGYWSQILSNLMGYGSLYFRSNLLAPWQWFTLINGILTFATSLAFYLYFPNSISTAHFLTEREKIVAMERVREHETSTCGTQGMEEALHDPKTWSFASFSLFNNIPTSIGIQRSLIVESLGFTRLQTTLLGTLDGIIESMFITIYTGVKLVEYFGCSRAYVGSAYMLSDVLSAILVTTLPWSNKVGLLISIYLTDIGTTGYVLGLAWVTSSTAGHTKRSTTQAIMLSAYCVGNLIGPHMWQVIGACYSICIVLMLVIRRRLEQENYRRDLLADEQGDDLTETQTDLTDIQNSKFRYVL
ncbi:membrane transporter [Rhizoctonia solani AG-1 IA]|uniref:Membrane transporter n=1 Tax=Thanatephorus cucumeris (strain AG1-IA) TaxID=983506 RepID=L8WG79_THACA|nr:membrane transporter [Rhizoctonia solani AG-1 IA]